MDGKEYPLVSVVIVSWNAREYLARCLQSLRNSAEVGSLEIIVVDNASSDGSEALVRESFPEVMLICNDDNLGFAKANNIGIARACGDYIALVNSDVELLEPCIGTLVSYLDRHPATGLVGPYVIGGDGKQQSSYRAAPTLWNELCRALALDTLFPHSRLFNCYLLKDVGSSDGLAVDILSGCFWLTTRRAIAEVGGLDEAFFIYGEDMDWCKRFRDAQWCVDFVPLAKVIHYGGGSSANSPIRFSVEMQKAISQYWRKHHSLPAVCGYTLIAFLHHSLRVIGHTLHGCLALRSGNSSWLKARRSLACARWLLIRGDCAR